MGVTQLIQVVSTLLAPFMSELLRQGTEVIEEAAKRAGSEAWEFAKAVWTRLYSRIEAKPSAYEAAQDLAQAPDDEDTRAAFRVQLRKVLSEDDALRRELLGVWEAAQQTGWSIAAIGDRAVAGHDLAGAVVITGDHVVLQYGGSPEQKHPTSSRNGDSESDA